jgi:hypothetical protein
LRVYNLARRCLPLTSSAKWVRKITRKLSRKVPTNKNFYHDRLTSSSVKFREERLVRASDRVLAHVAFPDRVADGVAYVHCRRHPAPRGNLSRRIRSDQLAFIGPKAIAVLPARENKERNGTLSHAVCLLPDVPHCLNDSFRFSRLQPQTDPDPNEHNNILEQLSAFALGSIF